MILHAEGYYHFYVAWPQGSHLGEMNSSFEAKHDLAKDAQRDPDNLMLYGQHKSCFNHKIFRAPVKHDFWAPQPSAWSRMPSKGFATCAQGFKSAGYGDSKIFST